MYWRSGPLLSMEKRRSRKEPRVYANMDTSPVVSLLAELAGLNIKLAVDGDHLRYRAPAGVLTPELRAVIGEHRTEIIGRLRNPANATTVRAPGCVPCDRQYWVDELPRNGRIRTTCGQCGRFIGYRPENL